LILTRAALFEWILFPLENFPLDFDDCTYFDAPVEIISSHDVDNIPIGLVLAYSKLIEEYIIYDINYKIAKKEKQKKRKNFVKFYTKK
jgi:hypothetical protein